MVRGVVLGLLAMFMVTTGTNIKLHIPKETIYCQIEDVLKDKVDLFFRDADIDLSTSLYDAKVRISKYKLLSLDNQSLTTEGEKVIYKVGSIKFQYTWKAETSLLKHKGTGIIDMIGLTAIWTPQGSTNGKINWEEVEVSFEDLQNDLGNSVVNFLADSLLTDLKSKATFLTKSSLSKYRVKALKFLNLTTEIDLGKISFKWYPGLIGSDANSVSVHFQLSLISKNKNLLNDEGDIKDVAVTTDDGSISIGMSPELAEVFNFKKVYQWPLNLIDFKVSRKIDNATFYSLHVCKPKEKTQEMKEDL